MAIDDWTFAPFSGFERMRRELDEVFQRFGPGNRLAFPAVNVRDAGDDILVAVEAPGVKKEAIKAELRDRVLTLSGSRQDDAPKDASLLRKETPSGEFVRALTLPVPVDGDRIEARYKDGILTLRMPKAESARPRSIAITA